MLAEVVCKNGVGVFVCGDTVVESFCVEGLFFVVFDNGKCVVESLNGSDSLVVDGLEINLKKFV